MTSPSSALVLPGQKLPVTGKPGSGTFELGGCLFASLVGRTYLEEATGEVTVIPAPESAGRSIVPQIGQVIIGKVTKITSRYAAVDISAIEQTSPLKSVHLPEPFRGTIRIQDVYAEDEKEVPQIPLAFRPGDLIRAKILGIGDAAAGFLLSTSLDPRYGVVFARGAASGEPLVPVAWNQMVCSKTGARETRKAARPDSL